MPNQILIDSSFLVALHDLDDKNHAAALIFSQADKRPRLIPDVTLPEAAHVIRYGVGQRGVLILLNMVIQANASLLGLTKPDIERAREIMTTYASANYDLADCCIMALSERLNITQVCTFDRRDFSIFRPKHCNYLELLP